MSNTGLSLYEEGYRLGGLTRWGRFESMAAACREPADNARLIAEQVRDVVVISWR
jgi:hypothetical protein